MRHFIKSKEYLIYLCTFGFTLILHILLLYFYGNINSYYINIADSILLLLSLLLLYSTPYIVYKILRLTLFIFKNGINKINLKNTVRITGKILLVFILLFSIFTLVDFFIFRGFYLIPIISKSTPKEFLEEIPDVNYSIQKTNEGWDFTIKNNSFSCFYFLAYRSIEYSLIFPDSLILLYGTRTMASIRGKEISDDSGFFCGTGLKEVVIFPKEEIRHTFRNIYELFPEHHYFQLSKIDNIPNTINVHFFLPVYHITGYATGNVISNSFEINTSQLMAILKKKNEEIRSLVENIK